MNISKARLAEIVEESKQCVGGLRLDVYKGGHTELHPQNYENDTGKYLFPIKLPMTGALGGEDGISVLITLIELWDDLDSDRSALRKKELGHDWRIGYEEAKEIIETWGIEVPNPNNDEEPPILEYINEVWAPGTKKWLIRQCEGSGVVVQ
jgi:hypothetical protein